MEAVIVAVIGVVGGVLVALIEKTRRENTRDHSVLGEKVELIGRTLGISIDRVERAVDRTEKKIDQHINDHARGEFDENAEDIINEVFASNKRRRSKNGR